MPTDEEDGGRSTRLSLVQQEPDLAMQAVPVIDWIMEQKSWSKNHGAIRGIQLGILTAWGLRCVYVS